MAIFITTPRTIGAMELDVSLKEDHQSDLTITVNPVEKGIDATDHASIEPKRCTIYGGYSNTTPSGAETIVGSNGTRIQSAWEQLLSLQASRELLSVQTGLKLYENMLISSLSCTQDEQTGQVLLFTASLQEVRVVDTLQISFPATKFSNKSVANRGVSTIPRGDVDAPNVDTTQQTTKSWAKRLLGG